MTMQAGLDAVLEAAVQGGDVPGVVGMVTDGSATVYQGAFGKRILGGDEAMSTDTVGLIASMTKALTATAVMQLVERGRLDLESPAARWLPELGEVQVLEGFDAGGAPRLRPPKRAITLRHLLTHTSGFGYEFFSADLKQYQQVAGVPPILSSLETALNMPLLFDPGERWEYGIGIDWAGRVVEAVTRQRLGQYLSENLLQPLGMNDTAFSMGADMHARLAAIHARLPDGSLSPLDMELPAEPGFDMGGGGLYSSLEDYLKFIRMVLNRGDAPGGRVLQADTVAAMARNQLGDLDVKPPTSVDPTLSNDFPLPPDNPHKWSLAWLINTRPLATGRPAQSLMWAGLTNAYYWIDPATGIGGGLLTQILPFADIKALPLFMEFESRVYQYLA